MNLTKTNTSLFQRLRIILVETSHPGNVGSVARAMKTMGFTELVLVNPRIEHVHEHPEALALASGAQDILQSVKIVSSIEEALEGCYFLASVSARLREFSPPIWAPRQFAEYASKEMSDKIALIFGNERFGLPNEIVLKSNVLINIPSNPDYSSLNLAQAVQLLSYECRIAALALSEENRENPLTENNDGLTQVGFQGKLAPAVDVERMYAHLELALIAIDFLDPASPKKLMPRLKRLFSRARIEVEEVNILRGIAKKILDKS